MQATSPVSIQAQSCQRTGTVLSAYRHSPVSVQAQSCQHTGTVLSAYRHNVLLACRQQVLSAYRNKVLSAHRHKCRLICRHKVLLICRHKVLLICRHKVLLICRHKVLSVCQKIKVNKKWLMKVKICKVFNTYNLKLHSFSKRFNLLIWHKIHLQMMTEILCAELVFRSTEQPWNACHIFFGSFHQNERQFSEHSRGFQGGFSE